MSNQSIEERICAGEFTNNDPYQKDSTGRRAWRIKSQQLTHNEFKQAIAEELGLKSHPKLDKLFSIAWEYGHSNGLTEVYICFCEFAELVS